MQGHCLSEFNHSLSKNNEGNDNMLSLSVTDAIKKIKEIAEKNNLSAQRIFEMVDDAHEHVSLNTVKKILSDGSETLNFNPDLSVFPVYRAITAVYGADTGNEQIDDLRATIRNKDLALSQLEARITELKERRDFLKFQIQLKDRRIDRLMGLLEAVTNASEDFDEKELYKRYGKLNEDE
jgi:hypothetical protein